MGFMGDVQISAPETVAWLLGFARRCHRRDNLAGLHAPVRFAEPTIRPVGWRRSDVRNAVGWDSLSGRDHPPAPALGVDSMMGNHVDRLVATIAKDGTNVTRPCGRLLVL